MMLFAAQLMLTALAPIELKQTIARQISVESFSEAALTADELAAYQDPEALYLAIQAYSGAQLSQKAIQLTLKHAGYLKEHNYYKKSLESVALGVFKEHYQSTQEPIKLAALAAISLESDARILELILEAFEHPSLKVKTLALRSLARFGDEKVKKILFETLKRGNHPSINLYIAKLFSLWQDKRILPVLHEKITEDGLSLDEKINYILIIKDLSHEISEEKIHAYCRSHLASERLLATYLMSASKHQLKTKNLTRLLSDPHLWVKQSALLTAIKKKVVDPEVLKVIKSWKNEKSFELVKGYYHYGLVNHNPQVIEEFLAEFKNANLDVKKSLASIVYASGPDHEPLVLQLINLTDDPQIRLHLGLYMLSGPQADRAVGLVIESLKQIDHKKIFVVTEPIYPFFVVQDEKNSSLTVSAGHRRAMDKHMRLKIFHLLAMKKFPEAKTILQGLLKSDLFEVSLDAMVHFWEHFGYEDSMYLKNILNEEDPELKLKAALVLSFLDFDKDIRKFLIDCYRKQPYSMQIQILFALSKYPEDDVIDFFVQQMQSKYPLIQAISAGCLFTALYN